MILVDSREDSKKKGSPGLWDDLKKTNLPLEQTTLDAGDLMFVGNGPEGEVTVGVEFKKIRDLLQSVRTKRLQGHQLLGLQHYDFRYLVIEGDWRHDDNGVVTIRSGFRDWHPVPGRMSAAELDKTLLGLTLRGGVYVQQCATRRDTIRWLQSLYRNWTDRPWDAHTSHIAIYRPPTLIPISDKRVTFSSFPGIGVKNSATVEKYFKGSIRRAVAARAKEWARIEGVGIKGAQRIDEFLQ